MRIAIDGLTEADLVDLNRSVVVRLLAQVHSMDHDTMQAAP